MKPLLFGLMAALLTAAMPAPTGHVNDSANIIPDEREAKIEDSLRAYEARTGIEIVVATTPSLDGMDIDDYSINLLRQWGVGKKGADNGLLIVLAPNDKKWSIKTGYGLEEEIPDAVASELGQDKLVPAYRDGRVADGIESVTQAIISRLGTASPEERALFARKIKEAQDRDWQATKANIWAGVGYLFGLVCVVLLFLGIILVVRRISESRRIRKLNAERRKSIVAYLQQSQPVPGQLIADLATIGLPNLPAWMQDDKEDFSEAFEAALAQASKVRVEMEDLEMSELDRAEELQGDHAALLQSAANYLEQLRSIPQQVAATRQAAEEVVKEACGEIDQLIALSNSLTTKGYRVSHLVPAINVDRLEQEKQAIASLLQDRGEGVADASEVVHDKASRLLARVRSLKETLNANIESQSTSASRIAALRKRISMFPVLLKEHRARLERLQTLAPRKRWASFVAGLPVFERTLEGIAPRTDAADHANSMDVQLFADAAATLMAAETSLAAVDASHKDASRLESAIVTAKQGYSNKFRSVEDEVSAARSLMSDSDVGSGAKSRLAEAQRMLDSCQTDDPSVDWIAVDELLAQASAKARQALQLATSDIQAARRERKRREEEEERRQRDEADRQRRAREIVESNSVTSFGSNASSSSSAFGGFGGGSGGGGGASGDL